MSRLRELAEAVRDGSARMVDVREMAELVLDHVSEQDIDRDARVRAQRAEIERLHARLRELRERAMWKGAL